MMNQTKTQVKSVVVYLSSSDDVDEIYFKETEDLAKHLVSNNVQIVYGGSACGCMKRLAETALNINGKVIGVSPKIFRSEMKNLTKMYKVETMHERKKLMMELSDACIALPGGIGTLEELLEAITWLKLRINVKPVVIVNSNGFYDPLIEMLENLVKKNFCDKRYWIVVKDVKEVIPSIHKWYEMHKTENVKQKHPEYI